MGFCNNSFLMEQLFTTTFPVVEEAVLWVGPRLKKGEGWNVVTQFFTLLNWLLSIVVLIVTAVAFRYFAKKAGEKDRKYRKLSECFLFIYSCFFNMGNSILPKDTKLRIICLSLGPFALNISAYLQGKLFGALTHPIYSENFGSSEELLKSIPMVIQKHMLPVLQSSGNNIFDNFIKSTRMSMGFDLQDVVKYQDRATVINQEILKYYSHFLPYIQTQEIMKYRIVLYVMKHDGICNVINNIIIKFIEHGILKKIISDMNIINVFQYQKNMDYWDGFSQVSSLKLSKMRGAFVVLSLGFIIATTLFLLEYFFNHFKCIKYPKNGFCIPVYTSKFKNCGIK